jgi:hypothetical protein
MDNQLNKGLIELQEKLKELSNVSEYIKQAGTIADNATIISQNLLKKHEEILEKIDDYISCEEKRVMDVSLILSNKLANKFEEFNKKNQDYINSSTNKSTNAIEKTQSVLEKGVGNFDKTQNQILNNLQVSKTKFDTILTDTQNKIQNEYKIIQNNQSSVIKEIERSKKEFNDFLIKTKSNITQELVNIKSNQDIISLNFIKILAETSKTFTFQVEDIEKILGNKLDAFRQTNIQNYKDLENTLKIKLDDNKLEIKKLIEKERQQVEEIVKKNSEELSKKIAQNQKDFKNLIWLVGGALAILIIFF